jgi:hypothetical protein
MAGAFKMDTLTRKYRREELKAISTRHPIYLASMQIIDNHGRTKWLSITDEELEVIRDILTKEPTR